MKFLSTFFASMLILSVAACDSGTDSSDTLATFNMRFSSTGLNKTQAPVHGSVKIADVSGTVFTITEARANVRHIQFDLPDSSQDSTRQISLDGPFIVDLIDGVAVPAIGAFEVPADIYKRIDVRLDDTRSEDGLIALSDPLLDNTLMISGTFDYNGNPERGFTIILKLNEDVRFENPNGIVIREGETNNVILNLNVGEWLENIDITQCLNDGDMQLETNGDLVINDHNGNGDCDNLEQKLKTNIKNKYDISVI